MMELYAIFTFFLWAGVIYYALKGKERKVSK